ncbi:MAG: hypothetical protein SGJ19_20220 [Planctomycetia bacterium]|nr:hypothetical protein [Planctomycetia bacterium]
MARVSEGRAEVAARELLQIRGWDIARPPKGNLLWRNEYRDFPQLTDCLALASKSGDSEGYPDFIVIDRSRSLPLMIGETKADPNRIDLACKEAGNYAREFIRKGIDVLAVGIAGSAEEHIEVRVQKPENGHWRPIEYRKSPIEWLPTPDETQRLLHNPDLFALDPEVPPPEVLEAKADEINRVLRECHISDARRPAVVAAFMLALSRTGGKITNQSEYVLTEINTACRKAFREAGKSEVEDSLTLDEANETLQNEAHKIIRILRLLNVPTLTGSHDYLGHFTSTSFATPAQTQLANSSRHATSPGLWPILWTCGRRTLSLILHAALAGF